VNDEYVQILLRLVAALAAGGIIGLERSFRGRAAGFRTHALVCLASSLLMLVTVYERQWFFTAWQCLVNLRGHGVVVKMRFLRLSCLLHLM